MQTLLFWHSKWKNCFMLLDIGHWRLAFVKLTPGKTPRWTPSMFYVILETINYLQKLSSIHLWWWFIGMILVGNSGIVDQHVKVGNNLRYLEDNRFRSVLIHRITNYTFKKYTVTFLGWQHANPSMVQIWIVWGLSCLNDKNSNIFEPLW